MNFFGRKPSQEIAKPIKHPFNRDKVNILLDLEERFHRNHYDMIILDKLCSYYSELVEFYDVTKDPMKYYYIDKIQIVAVSKQNFIKHKNAQLENQTNGCSLSGVLKEEDAIGLKTTKNDIEAFKQRLGNGGFNPVASNPFNANGPIMPKTTKIGEYTSKKTPVVSDHRDRQKRRARKFEFENKKDDVGRLMQRQASDMMLTKIEKSQANDDIVKNHLSSQEDRIKEKIRQRSLASFNRSVTKAYTSQGNNEQESSVRQDTSEVYGDMESIPIQRRAQKVDTSNILGGLNFDDNAEMMSDLQNKNQKSSAEGVSSDSQETQGIKPPANDTSNTQEDFLQSLQDEELL